VSESRDLLARGTLVLAAAGIESSRLDARVLLADAMHLPSGEIVTGSGEPTASERENFLGMVSRRAAREPLAYIVGRREFWSLSFAVGPGVLVPRPETELLVEEAIRSFPSHNSALRILDLGTGSGCILLSLLTHFANARGAGVDASSDALVWARRNAAALGLERRCTLREGIWAEGLEGPFDLIVSNPPYVDGADMAVLAPEVGRHEPLLALRGGPDGLEAYRIIAPQMAGLLAPGGHAILEVGQGQAPAVEAILLASGIETMRIAADLAGIPRCIVGRRKTQGQEKTVGNLGLSG
jgi:release factor glutamine methyltransferase